MIEQPSLGSEYYKALMAESGFEDPDVRRQRLMAGYEVNIRRARLYDEKINAIKELPPGNYLPLLGFYVDISTSHEGVAPTSALVRAAAMQGIRQAAYLSGNDRETVLKLTQLFLGKASLKVDSPAELAPTIRMVESVKEGDIAPLIQAQLDDVAEKARAREIHLNEVTARLEAANIQLAALQGELVTEVPAEDSAPEAKQGFMNKLLKKFQS